MSDTPRTDERVKLMSSNSTKRWELRHVSADFARQLERELNAAKTALSGRTVSCSNCNETANPCDWKQDNDGNWDTQCGHPINFINYTESLV